MPTISISSAAVLVFLYVFICAWRSAKRVERLEWVNNRIDVLGGEIFRANDAHINATHELWLRLEREHGDSAHDEYKNTVDTDHHCATAQAVVDRLTDELVLLEGEQAKLTKNITIHKL